MFAESSCRNRLVAVAVVQQMLGTGYSVVTGLQVAGLKVAGLLVAGLRVAGLQVAGLQVVDSAAVTGMQKADGGSAAVAVWRRRLAGCGCSDGHLN